MMADSKALVDWRIASIAKFPLKAVFATLLTKI
jgi:hypothetical protein